MEEHVNILKCRTCGGNTKLSASGGSVWIDCPNCRVFVEKLNDRISTLEAEMSSLENELDGVYGAIEKSEEYQKEIIDNLPSNLEKIQKMYDFENY